jgi:hypothetical protein
MGKVENPAVDPPSTPSRGTDKALARPADVRPAVTTPVWPSDVVRSADMSRFDAAIRAVRLPVYLVLLIAIVQPVNEIIPGILPLRIHNVTWRVGAMGLSANNLLGSLFSIMLLFLFAIAARDGVTRRILGGLCVVFSPLAAAGIVLFLLDYLQMRPLAEPASLVRFDIISMMTVAKLVLLSVATALLARSAFRNGVYGASRN